MADYARISLLEVEELPIGLYLLWRRDAYIADLMQSEGGREYLRTCRMLEQTEPDRKALRKKFGKEIS